MSAADRPVPEGHVRVKIVAIVNSLGDWVAAGDAKRSVDNCAEELGEIIGDAPTRQTTYVTADLPIPQVDEIEGSAE